MKLRILLIVLVWSIISAKSQSVLQTNNAKDYKIIPKPAQMLIAKGRFTIDSGTKISASNELLNEATFLTQMLSVASGNHITTVENKSEANVILALDNSVGNNEGYTLTIRKDKIHITGKTATGVFYGIQSLRQLLPPTSETGVSGTLSLPAVDIIDEPRFTYRGMHLDVGRHFFPVEFIKTYIDLIALHKMNTFHWHLTEDQGWRIEIKKYPKLTEVGAWRSETLIGHMSGKEEDYKYDGKKYGGFYTQEEIKEIVAYAITKHVTIIPEIDLPGHSLAALAAYPQYGNFEQEYKVATKWGVFPQIYAPTEETFTFLEDILSEVADLFPSKYIHIGGDEAPKEEWENSEFAQDLMKKEGLANEYELQSYYMKRISDFLKTKDKYIIGWDDIIEGGLAEGATVMYWRHLEGSIKSAEEGHNIIMTPGSHCYFDYYQVPNRKRKKEPLAIGGFLTVEKVYSYEPIPESISKEASQHIIGAQGNVWTEYMTTTDYVEYMALPRMTALSEVVWSSKESRNWKDFKNRLQYLVKRYDAMGVNYAKHSLK